MATTPGLCTLMVLAPAPAKVTRPLMNRLLLALSPPITRVLLGALAVTVIAL